jgi:hypothetical protein
LKFRDKPTDRTGVPQAKPRGAGQAGGGESMPAWLHSKAGIIPPKREGLTGQLKNAYTTDFISLLCINRSWPLMLKFYDPQGKNIKIF